MWRQYVKQLKVWLVNSDYILARLLDQLAVYNDQNNDKWFAKQRKMIENHAINEKKRSS